MIKTKAVLATIYLLSISYNLRIEELPEYSKEVSIKAVYDDNMLYKVFDFVGAIEIRSIYIGTAVVVGIAIAPIANDYGIYNIVMS